MTERVYSGMSAGQRAARRHAQFLDAGLEVFADRGWAAATVTDICACAGLSPRYFYELFGSREELFHAVTARVADDVRATVRDALGATAGEPDPQRRARAVLTALAQRLGGDPREIRVTFMESLATPGFRLRRRELLDSFSDLTARLMRPLGDGRSADELRVGATVLTGGTVEMLIRHATDPDPAPRLEPLVDHLTALFTAAARSGG